MTRGNEPEPLKISKIPSKISRLAKVKPFEIDTVITSLRKGKTTLIEDVKKYLTTEMTSQFTSNEISETEGQVREAVLDGIKTAFPRRLMHTGIRNRLTNLVQVTEGFTYQIKENGTSDTITGKIGDYTLILNRTGEDGLTGQRVYDGRYQRNGQETKLPDAFTATLTSVLVPLLRHVHVSAVEKLTRAN